MENKIIRIVGPDGIIVEITFPWAIESDEEYYELLRRIGKGLIEMEDNVVSIVNISEK